jgi:hypothetical protein
MSPFRRVHFDLPRWVIAVLIVGPFALGLTGAYVTVRGHDRTCDLRGDLVFVLQNLESRATSRADSIDEAKRIRSGYSFMIKHIRDNTCEE